MSRKLNKDLKKILNDYNKSILKIDCYSFSKLCKYFRGNKKEINNLLKYSKGLYFDIYCYNGLLSHYIRVKNKKSIDNLLEEMYQNYIRFDIVTYNTLLKYYCDNKLSDEVNNLLEEMYKDNIRFDIFTYSTLLKYYCDNNLHKFVSFR